MADHSYQKISDGRYKFSSKERDNETGLDYFGKRYYDSRLGRWVSVDPLAEGKTEYPGGEIKSKKVEKEVEDESKAKYHGVPERQPEPIF